MNLVTLNLTQNKIRASRRGLFSEVTSILARLTKLDAISRAERTLSRLPDELLADMGIKRSEIADAVRFGRRDDGCAGAGARAKIIELRRPSSTQLPSARRARPLLRSTSARVVSNG